MDMPSSFEYVSTFPLSGSPGIKETFSFPGVGVRWSGTGLIPHWVLSVRMRFEFCLRGEKWNTCWDANYASETKWTISSHPTGLVGSGLKSQHKGGNPRAIIGGRESMLEKISYELIQAAYPLWASPMSPISSTSKRSCNAPPSFKLIQAELVIEITYYYSVPHQMERAIPFTLAHEKKYVQFVNLASGKVVCALPLNHGDEGRPTHSLARDCYMSKSDWISAE